MKKTIKGFILGVLVSTLLISIAFGEQTKKTIEVIYNSINITVNGEKIGADNILYNGTTYVPLRKVAEALDKEVVWDEKSSTVNINNKSIKSIKEQKPEEEVKLEKKDITNASELKEYLQENFGTLKTVIGDTNFKIKIHENDRTFLPEDYWIMVDYDYNFFEGATGSTKYTSQEKEVLKKQLKDHMENLGQAAIKAMPNKKIQGGYYKSWYRYPNLQVDLITRRYYSWKNYGEYDILSSIDVYEQAKPSYFRWSEDIDDKL